MGNHFRSTDQRGQGTVENLMMTAIIAGLLIPVVYKYALTPMLDTMQGQRKNLVDFVSQTNKKPVPTAWFASERLAQIKETQNIEAPKDIGNPNEIPPPGEISSPNDIKSPQNIKSPDIKSPKNIASPRDIPPPATPGQKGGGSGAGGAGSALGGGAQDPDFFGNGSKPEGPGSSDEGGSSGSSQGYGAKSGQFDEYAPKSSQVAQSRDATKTKDEVQKDKTDGSAERRDRQNLLLSETREEENARSSPFDWWLLVKLLILALIIFLVILIGLSNMKKR